MPTLIQINVTNDSPYLQNFYFFQQPAAYSGGSEVYSNSLLSTPILPSKNGAVYNFLVELQYCAGVQQRFAPPVIGEPSGYTSAIQSIGLTPAQGGAESNCTSMLVSPSLGLTPPVNNAGVEPGAFRIIAPQFDPNLTPYNGGSAVQFPNGSIVLSNFVPIQPLQNLDCQPVLKFYVATGTYTQGTVMNFTDSSVAAAVCDATTGFTTFDVTYNVDGTWTVKPSLGRLQRTVDERGRVSVKSVELNASIKNEAGTQVICRGHAQNFSPPIVIDHLTAPRALHVHSEYQVGPSSGPYKGHMCSGVSPITNAATFS